MKFSRIVFLLLGLLIPYGVNAQGNVAAERAWKPFIATFRAALKKRDRATLKEMMAKDFFTSNGVGDDNQDGDSRDEAFEFWDEPSIRGWEAFDRVLGQGVAPAAKWWNNFERSRYVRRIAPVAANVRRNIKLSLIPWYAIFEFREGRWYAAVFAICCDL